jgi:hypothetical protein
VQWIPIPILISGWSRGRYRYRYRSWSSDTDSDADSDADSETGNWERLLFNRREHRDGEWCALQDLNAQRNFSILL